LHRREFCSAAGAALVPAAFAAKPDSKFKGVQIGTITYSFRQLPGSAAEILNYCTGLGISSVELMGDVAETYAGAPAPPRRPGGGMAKGGGKAGLPKGARVPMSPEARAAIEKAAEERKQWRLSASMDKFKALGKMYRDAGVNIPILKLSPSPQMGDDELDYVFNAVKAVGANCVTLELPTDMAFARRLGEFGEKHKVYVGYHNHMQLNESSWDTVLAQSRYNSINLDVGHFTEAISKSPIPFIRKYHDRITSFHLKDKKYGTNGGGNTIWGQGQVPLKEVLQLMAKEKYRWPANIELEYEIPEGSSVLAEMGKCVAFCREALA
jgi:sugar phosphate isomerase/epimerase